MLWVAAAILRFRSRASITASTSFAFFTGARCAWNVPVQVQASKEVGQEMKAAHVFSFYESNEMEKFKREILDSNQKKQKGEFRQVTLELTSFFGEGFSMDNAKNLIKLF